MQKKHSYSKAQQKSAQKAKAQAEAKAKEQLKAQSLEEKLIKVMARLQELEERHIIQMKFLLDTTSSVNAIVAVLEAKGILTTDEVEEAYQKQLQERSKRQEEANKKGQADAKTAKVLRSVGKTD